MGVLQMEKVYVEIVERKTGIVEERILCSSDAEKVQKGVNINLNKKDYSTRIVTVTSE
jgi:hypothetical protein